MVVEEVLVIILIRIQGDQNALDQMELFYL